MDWALICKVAVQILEYLFRGQAGISREPPTIA
jgi:hypothetical protein